MKVAIFCGGEFSNVILQPYDALICADKGYDYAKRLNLTPTYVLGDFDSLGYIPENAEIFPADKNFSDTELAVYKAIEIGATEITLYFALKGRIDHELFNISLLSSIKSKGILAKIIDDNCVLEVINSTDIGRKYQAVKEKVVSIVPISKTAHILKSEGLLYDAKGEIVKGTTLTLSNVAISSEILVDVSIGEVILIIYN